MKKCSTVALVALLIIACRASRSDDTLPSITSGLTESQVVSLVGTPALIISDPFSEIPNMACAAGAVEVWRYDRGTPDELTQTFVSFDSLGRVLCKTHQLQLRHR